MNCFAVDAARRVRLYPRLKHGVQPEMSVFLIVMSCVRAQIRHLFRNHRSQGTETILEMGRFHGFWRWRDVCDVAF